ncbi:MAG: biotin/lipoate A/B protein ligase family protein [Planctomycetaceae bacterium]
MTTIPVWWDGPADGPANMAADECLADEAVAAGGPVVRLYGWTATTVSLGAFQPVAAARAEPAIAGAALVRRPSGGGAIVHGSDLTYAAAVPRTHPLAGRPQALYTAFHAALVEVLAGLGVAARMCAAGEPAARGGPDAFFCFDRRAEGDVVVRGSGPAAGDAKILGSAQRRLAAAVVQHGSLLLRRAEGVGEAARHPGLFDLHAEAAAVGPDALARRWLEAVARGGGVAWRTGAFARGREARISSLAGTFGTARWLERR